MRWKTYPPSLDLAVLYPPDSVLAPCRLGLIMLAKRPITLLPSMILQEKKPINLMHMFVVLLSKLAGNCSCLLVVLRWAGSVCEVKL